MEEAGIDVDGQINYEEFVRMMMSDQLYKIDKKFFKKDKQCL